MQKDIIDKIRSIFQCQEILEKLRLKNHFFAKWRHQKTHFAPPKTSQKTKT